MTDIRKIVIFDRDGTVIVDPSDECVDSLAKVKIFPDTNKSLRLLAENNFDIVLVTNQSGIAEGRLTIQEFDQINRHVVSLLEKSGVHVLKTYMSPHAMGSTDPWRKPGPGMLIAAATEFAIDLPSTFMAGDRRTDVLAGINAGCRSILVKTGSPKETAPEAEYTAETLLETVEYIIEQSRV